MSDEEKRKNMIKSNKKLEVSILVIIILLLPSIILYYIVSFIAGQTFVNMGEQGTKLTFISENNTDIGFNREEAIYTESGITSINFSGKITVKGTADISIISEAGNVVYSHIYTNVKSTPIKFKVTGLSPNSYYFVKFTSEDAQSGSLTLISDESLEKQPEHPEKPVS